MPPGLNSMRKDRRKVLYVFAPGGIWSPVTDGETSQIVPSPVNPLLAFRIVTLPTPELTRVTSSRIGGRIGLSPRLPRSRSMDNTPVALSKD